LVLPAVIEPAASPSPPGKLEGISATRKSRMLSPFTKAISVANFCTLSKRRCEPLSLTSPPDRAAVAQAELSANELGDNKSPGGAVLFPVYRKPNLYYQAAKETVGF